MKHPKTASKTELNDFEEDELFVWRDYLRAYVTELIRGDVSLEEFVSNIESFRNTKDYTGSNDKYKKELYGCTSLKIKSSR
jgi:hypothetical protein